jgi:choice-of-anchor B domain-containing protein
MNADLMSFLPLQDFGARLSRDENNTLVIDDIANDIWGWADPVSGREFAIIGMSTGTSFIEISNPSNPIHIGVLPTRGKVSLWRDIKTFRNHAFIVAEGGEHGMQVSIVQDVIVCEGCFIVLDNSFLIFNL